MVFASWVVASCGPAEMVVVIEVVSGVEVASNVVESMVDAEVSIVVVVVKIASGKASWVEVTASDVIGSAGGVEVSIIVVVVVAEVAASGVKMAVVPVDVEVISGKVSGVEVATSGVNIVVVLVVVEVVSGKTSEVEVAASVVALACVEVVVVVTVVEVATGKVSGVEVADGIVNVDVSRISETTFVIRCLLSHSATAVTPACHESYVRVLPLSSFPTLPGFRVLTALPAVPKLESCSIIAIINRVSTL